MFGVVRKRYLHHLYFYWHTDRVKPFIAVNLATNFQVSGNIEIKIRRRDSDV